jgi:uncharacterized protein YccT (UPF0319 family)
MGDIVTRRDYHITRFRMEQFLEKGFDRLTQAELEELRDLSRDMSRYEQVSHPASLQQQQRITTRGPQ